MLSFEPLNASIGKTVFEILETPPGARRALRDIRVYLTYHYNQQFFCG